MNRSESQTSLARALFAARQQIPPIPKSAEGQSGNRKFNYAPLDAILHIVTPILTAHGLMLTQGTEGHELITLLEHPESGEWRMHRMPLYEVHANLQSYGIEVSYRRRYAVPLILGIVTEEDKDIKGRNERKGADHTTDQPKSVSAREVALGASFGNLQPEIQDQMRRAVEHATKAMPNVAEAINILSMARDNWPDFDAAELTKAQWYLLDSNTRRAIKDYQKRETKPRHQPE